MTITEWAKEIHENAVKHGWWETKRSTGEVIALIHSELSEALEEARDNRPMMYVLGPNGEEICTPCYFNGRKPEGIAVELADAVIRVLDFAEYMRLTLKDTDTTKIKDRGGWCDDLGTTIAVLHEVVAMLGLAIAKEKVKDILGMMWSFVACIELYLKNQGVDLWQVIEIKHNYNKGRPYKHGKAF